MNKIKLLLLTVFLIFISLTKSNAEIIFQDSSGLNFSGIVPFTQSSFSGPDGLVGDFQLLMCATFSDGTNSFNPATPDWTAVNTGGCAGDPDCILGIFEKFINSEVGESATCNWTVGTEAIIGVIFRYTGVDPFNPVIGSVQCNSGIGGTATAPSVFTEANSVVVRIFAALVPIDQISDTGFGTFFGTTFSGDGSETLSAGALGIPFANAGQAPPFDATLEEEGSWRACSVALKMASPQIPTLNQWGKIITMLVIGLFAVIGIFAMRRRNAEAN